VTAPRPTDGVTAHHFSVTRLWGIVLVFLVLSGYAVWKSERFQNLVQGVSQKRLSDALGRPVTFNTVDFRVFPPSVRLADVKVANDPRIPGPFLSAEEVSIGGGVSLVGQELRLGRIRALRPHIELVQFPDGTWNLPPNLARPTKAGGGGVSVKVGSIIVQEGIFDFDGRQMRFTGRLEDFAAELKSRPGNRYRAALVARKTTVRIAGSEPLVAAMSLRFDLDPKQGIAINELKLEGKFGRVRATGALENLSHPRAVFSASGEVVIEEIERIFHAQLGFSGEARVDATFEVPPDRPFRLAGRIQAAKVSAPPFTLEDIAASVTATPDALVAEIERAGYSGGRVSGTLRIANLASKPQPMTLAVEGRGISIERFFGDIGLKGTGLSGAAGVSLALRWGEAGLTKADGGGSLRIEPGPATSLVRGRFGVPVAGGGPVAVVGGKVVLEGVALKLPQSTVDLTGGFKIGVWQPDFDFRIRSKDLSEIDRVFQNFLAAGGSKPEPLGLGGNGEVAGHLGGRWTLPEATAQIIAEEARYANVRFGSVRGTVEMREGAFYFRPLRVYEGDAALSLEGMARYQPAPGQPKLDLQASARNYPLARLLEYLGLKYPVDGRVTGAFPVTGTTEALTGGGPLELTDAVAWGQRLSRVTARIAFTPGRVALEDVQAELVGGGSLAGRGAFSMKERSFEARASGKDIPLSSIEALHASSSDVAGRLSFQLSGAGPVDRPDLRATASITDAAFFGHAVPHGQEPRLEATITGGVLDAAASVPDRWTLHAGGDLFGKPPRVDVSLDAKDLSSLLLLTPFQLPSGRGGSLAATGKFTLPSREGEFPSGTITVTRARLDLPDRPGVLATSGEVRISLADGKLTFDQFRATGEGTDLKAGGSITLGSTPVALDLAVNGTVDAALLAIELPEVGLTGKLAVDLRAGGTLDAPALSGRVRIENARYRVASLSQFLDDIDATLTFDGPRANLEARARFGGGDVYAGGSFRLEKLSMKDFRVNVQARHVALRYPQDLRLSVDADLVASGTGSKNDLRGEVTLLRGTYSKDFEVTLTDLLARSRPAGALVSAEPWKEQTSLEVRIVSSAALEVRNNLARLTATVDLLARGTVAEPAITGQITVDEGGRIKFRDVRYDVESGTITFANARGFTPILDIRARAEVRGYDLVVSLVGTWPRIQTSFSSDPPLPDEQILGLLLTGTAPATTRSGTDTTSESIVSAGASLAAGAAAGALTRPTQKFFKLDVFEIDPVFSGGQLSDIRSTVGTQIGPNLLVTTSQSFDTSKTPIFQFEWRVSNTIIVRARRDENGVYLIDVRRRTRY
jgi:hypothetical protein